jgi:hypothetical protein
LTTGPPSRPIASTRLGSNWPVVLRLLQAVHLDGRSSALLGRSKSAARLSQHETLGHFLLPLRLPLLCTGRTAAAAAWRLAHSRRLAGEDGTSVAGTRPGTDPLFPSDPSLPSPSSSYPHSQGSERAPPMAARKKVAVLPVAGGFAGDGDGLRRQPVASTLSPFSSPSSLCSRMRDPDGGG